MPKNKTSWKVPKNFYNFFDPHYDDDFKKKHPVLYALTIVGILLLVCVGPFIMLCIFACIEGSMEFEFSFLESLAFLFGFVSSMGISIGLCNLFMILHKQYLGHFITLISFGVGIVGVGLSSLMIWLI